MSHKQLSAEIVALSTARQWDKARLEWSLEAVYFADEAETCLCGHFPIIELCILRNRSNQAEATVGNHCVKKFMGLPSDKIFGALKRIKRKEDAALGPDAIEYAHRRRWMNDWERDFYFDTWRKRSLSVAQSDKRAQINRKVLEAVEADTKPARTR